MNASSAPSTWPPISHERQHWVSKDRAEGIAASRMPMDDGEYESAVPPMIASLDFTLSKSTAALVEDAAEVLVRFDTSLSREIAPFASLLLRSEAVASSRIENLSASARAILTAELGPTTRTNASVIVSNLRAMQAALELADDLSPESVLAMHRVLLAGDPRHVPGAWREEAVWIGRSNRSPLGADFVAPASKRVPELVDDVMQFAARDDLSRLPQAIIAHAQFETIHPFTDGNGRTGRALLQSMLRAKGLTTNVTVPISAGLLTNTDEYHRALTAYRSGDITPIVELAAHSSFAAIQNAEELVADVRTVQAGWRDKVKARSDSAVWRVLDVIARQPVLTAKVAAHALGIEARNAYPALKILEDAGVLTAKSEYKIGRVWRSREILSALDDFAARAGRRG